MGNKTNPVKTKFIDNSTSIVTIDLNEVKERTNSNSFSFIIQTPSPSNEGSPFRVIYNVKGFLKAG